jgi:hypothetical protein
MSWGNGAGSFGSTLTYPSTGVLRFSGKLTSTTYVGVGVDSAGVNTSYALTVGRDGAANGGVFYGGGAAQALDVQTNETNANPQIRLRSGTTPGFLFGDGTAAVDVNLNRTAASTLALGNGTLGNTTGTLNLATLNAATSITGSPAATLGATTVTTLGMGGTLTVGANTLALASATISGQPTWSSSQTIPGLTVGANTLNLTSSTVSGTPTWSSSQAITLSTAAQPNITSLGTLTNLNVGSGAAGTSTTSGFVSTQTGAGTPTGTPSSIVTGSSPLYVDSTNAKTYAYYGSAWHNVGDGGASAITITADTSSPISPTANTYHSNSGSSVDITYNLPTSPTTGTTIAFYVVANHYCKLQAPASTTIYLGTTTCATAGYVRSTAVGSTVTLIAVSSTVWMAWPVTGTWTVDS